MNSRNKEATIQLLHFDVYLTQSYKTFGICSNPFTCSMQNATKISRFSVLTPVNIFAGCVRFTITHKTDTESQICCVWEQISQHNIAAKDRFTFDLINGNNAMRSQEDKMVQVSLPWNNLSTVRAPRSIPVSPTAPEHFSTEQINKLESRFSHQKWPDKTGVIILAMESNLLSKDVEVQMYIFYSTSLCFNCILFFT